MKTSTRLALLGQLLFVAGIALCTALLPHFAFERNEGGVSNYGVHAQTVVPFSIAFLGCGACTVAAGLRFDARKVRAARCVKPLLIFVGLMLITVALTTYPYKVSAFFDDVHEAVSSAYVLVELAIGFYFWRLARTRLATAFFGAQALGFVLAAATYFGALHVLFIAEVLAGCAFGALLVDALSALDVRR